MYELKPINDLKDVLYHRAEDVRINKRPLITSRPFLKYKQ